MPKMAEQFRHPRGFLGRVVGHFMALKNRKRNEWAVELLDPAPGERVVEVGFGPGTDIRRVAQRVCPDGQVAGVDISDAMVAQAHARNQNAVEQGLVDLVRGSIEHALPFEDAQFDAAYSINSAQFWPDLSAGFEELRRVVKRGGRMLVAVQPRLSGGSRKDSSDWCKALHRAAEHAGWVRVSDHLGPSWPPVAAVTAIRPWR